MSTVATVLLSLPLAALHAWAVGALFYTPPLGAAARALLAGALLVVVPVLLFLPGAPWPSLAVLAVGAAGGLVSFFRLHPSNEGAWEDNDARMPWAEVEGHVVTLHGVRHTRYRTDADYDVRTETRRYDLRDLDGADFAIAPFAGFQPGAHTFASFSFRRGERLVLSIEARRPKGETYGILPGLYRRFGLVYLYGDERDFFGLRTHVRGETLIVYPMRSTPEGLRTFFLDTVRRANALCERPVFYNSAVRNCTIELLRHLNRVRALKIRVGWKILFSGFSDARALELGLLDTDLRLEEAREAFRVDPSLTTLDDPDFSEAIRRRRPHGP